jgi:hypothetical protein
MMKSMLNVEKTGPQNWVQCKNNPNLHEHQPRKSIEKKPNKIQATKNKKQIQATPSFLPNQKKITN